MAAELTSKTVQKSRDLHTLKLAELLKAPTTLEAKVDQLLEGQQAISRVILEHDAWISTVRGWVSRAVRWGGPVMVGLLARSEVVPPWLRAVWTAVVGGEQ